MAASVFHLKLIEPTKKMLDTELGASKAFFEEICSFLKDNYGEPALQWKYYNAKSGWILKVFHGKRNVLFLIPCNGFFRVSFTFGDKAVDQVVSADVPEYIKREVIFSKKHPEGRTIQLEVKTEGQCNSILKLIRVKLDT